MSESVELGFYQHFKGGRYEVLGVALPNLTVNADSEPIGHAKFSESPERSFDIYGDSKGCLHYDGIGGRDMVLYRSLKDDSWWLRPVEMFLEHVDKPEHNYSGPRFKKIE